MRRTWIAFGIAVTLAACGTTPDPEPATSSRPAGRIIAAGVELPIDVPVVTWKDPGGFDATQKHCHFTPERVLPTRPARGCNTPERYRTRPTTGLSAATREAVARDGWTLEALRERIRLFVFHYDVCVTSSRCFEVLHDRRGLSVHFLLDVDGTLYQTLDISERARHAGSANDASIGIEIAHIGAYPPGNDVLARYYTIRPDGRYDLEIPEALRPPPGRFTTARPGLFRRVINGRPYVMPDFTEAQYVSLVALVDALSEAFPRLRRAVPEGWNLLDAQTQRTFEGYVGHYHVSRVKADPGPAFDWNRILRR